MLFQNNFYIRDIFIFLKLRKLNCFNLLFNSVKNKNIKLVKWFHFHNNFTESINHAIKLSYFDVIDILYKEGKHRENIVHSVKCYRPYIFQWLKNREKDFCWNDYHFCSVNNKLVKYILSNCTPLYMPLNFWFTRSTSIGIPSIAIPFSGMRHYE